MFTPQINNIRTTYLINTNAQHLQVLEVKHGLRLTKPRFKRSLYANISRCDVHAAIANIHHIPKRAWRAVVVDNLTLTDAENPLARLLHNAVHTKKDNIILAPVNITHTIRNSGEMRLITHVHFMRTHRQACIMRTPTPYSIASR